jgi:ribosomal protein L44E
MEEDIFMDYTTSSSGQASPVSSFSVPFEAIRLGRRLDELKSHKENIVSALKSDSNNRILVLDMRRYNRHLFGVVNEHRKRLNELKTSIDSLNNRLLCHKFEKQHLLNEIEACKNSKYLNLV